MTMAMPIYKQEQERSKHPADNRHCNRWPLKCYVIQLDGCVRFPGKECYEGVRFNVNLLYEGVGGCQISRKKV